ncbi:hypothetical protein GcC1_199032 [Golovinomyces cichoracearum]|uniref:Uncharacterized protein n=1 Tax=Golovinomyces cichoracearum TaxID=62708 RepID=A0A420HEZ2_9PEZI|nr:hypothetical protein GcC1_199032 [Golovinomyces cichoracearum]
MRFFGIRCHDRQTTRPRRKHRAGTRLKYCFISPWLRSIDYMIYCPGVPHEARLANLTRVTDLVATI